MKWSDSSVFKVIDAIPLPQVEGAPRPSDNNGLQDESAPAGEGHGPSCRRIPGKAHVDWGIDSERKSPTKKEKINNSVFHSLDKYEPLYLPGAGNTNI